MPTYRIADLIVRMDCGGKTAKQAEPYRIEDSDCVDITISIPREKIIAARADAPHLSEDDWEYILSSIAFYQALVRHDGFMLHASALLYQGRAFLFSAPSGTGKSTHTALWQKQFGEDNVRILNDDKPAIRRIDGRFFAYGTPWSGKHDISIPIGVPLAGICFLFRSETLSMSRLPAQKALSNLFSQTLRRLNDDNLDLLFDQLSALLCEVPIYQLHSNTSPDAAVLAERTMNRTNPTPTFAPVSGRIPYTIRDGYTLRSKVGSNIIAHQDDDRFIGLTTLNSTGVFLFRVLEHGATADELALALTEEYGIDATIARVDAERFLARLSELGIIQK